MQIKKSFLTLVLLLSFPANGSALDDRYPPFDIKAFKDRMLNAELINKPEERGEFKDRDLSIKWTSKGMETSRVEIRYKNKLTVQVELPGKDDYSNAVGEIYYADLDGNALPDIIIHPAFYGSGLGSFYKTTTILFQATPGQFRRLDFTSFYFGPEDFVDLKGDGHYQLLMMQLMEALGQDRKPHNFWVYTPYEIKDFSLRMDRDPAPGFPKFIWYTERSNDKPTDKLTQQQKGDFLRTLPSTVESKLVKTDTLP